MGGNSGSNYLSGAGATHQSCRKEVMLFGRRRATYVAQGCRTHI
uniref:Uncharacterized protein n=1 Tax=Anguilla anguilla TaxID=7936 RepID=A0A0E9R715_ANGAN